jgi:hypothetical protein
MQGGREGGRVGGREGGRNAGREGGREGGRGYLGQKLRLIDGLELLLEEGG